MSKSLEGAFAALKGVKNGASKFTQTAQEGSRLVPSRTKDNSIAVRIDAGRYIAETKKLNVVLQVNSQAKGGLADWRKKNSSHEKLATEEFDTSATNQKAEYDRVLSSLQGQAKEKLKDITDNNNTKK